MSKTNIPYEAPRYALDGFNCPLCHAYSTMHWADGKATYWSNHFTTDVSDVAFVRCSRCNKWSVWYDEKLIYPNDISVDDPNEDLPEVVKNDYREAASILQDSPRGSAALLRLAIQRLCDALVEGEDDLNTKIGTLVRRGLDSKIQKALDAVRVIGNEAVHPGQIDLNDSPQIAGQLFKLVNIVGHRMITEPAEVDAIYDMIPQAKKDGITARDKSG